MRVWCEKIPAFVLAFAAVLLVADGTAFAHEAAGAAGGFAAGFAHPFGGLDHLVAMFAVGLWGAFLGGRAVWILPVAFPLVMTMGAIAGLSGLSLPHVETGIALSALVLGLLVAFAVRAPLGVAGLIVGAFAVFHGHAHGTELPQAADAVSYSAGFVLATGLIHLAGIALGLVTAAPVGRLAVRAGGGAIAAAGLWFLVA